MLKEIAEEISIPLVIVFNLSILEGIVSLEWKIANVVPIFKNGNRCKQDNYRPLGFGIIAVSPGLSGLNKYNLYIIVT